MPAALIAPIALAAVAWLWFLARGRSSGALKRAALRASLLALCTGLVILGARRGLFVNSTVGFRIAILFALLTVAVGYLYLIRFCPSCGRMVRNLRDRACPRCSSPLPLHGMTSRLHRSSVDLPWDPLAKPQRRSTEGGPRA